MPLSLPEDSNASVADLLKTVAGISIDAAAPQLQEILLSPMNRLTVSSVLTDDESDPNANNDGDSTANDET